MAGRADPTRDLRLGWLALEAGAVDPGRLIDAVREWASSPGKTLAEVLSAARAVEPGTLARLESEASSGPPSPAAGGVADEGTVAYEGPPPGASGPAPASAVSPARFRVVGPHARGGLGQVFLAVDTELDRTVALKELQPRLAHDPDAQARFLREARVTGSLEHPGIVPVYGLGRHPDGRPYYAMHLVRGETLRVAIDRFHRDTGAARRREDRELPFRRLLRCVIDACNAVAYAHERGVVHRDLKPENVMLGRFGETFVVDWGVARGLPGDSEATPPWDDLPADASMTQPGAVLGTPRYMSPEQALGDLDAVGPASDIYSLGAILYCVLTGHDPVSGGDVPTVLDRVRRGIFPAPRTVLRSVDPALEAVCLRAMARDPGERFASALELAEALESWLADVRYRVEQERALGQAKGSLTRLCLDRAHRAFDQGSHPEGMLWLARALENAPPPPDDLQRVVRASLYGWHVGPKLLERSFRHGGDVLAIAVCPAGRRLATAGSDGTVRLWDVSTGSSLAGPLSHDGPVRAVAYGPDGALVAAASDDGTVRLWDAVTGAPRGRLEGRRGPARALCFNADGTRVAACVDGRLLLWDTSAARPVAPDEPPAGPVGAVAVDPAGTTFAVAVGSRIELREPTGGRQIRPTLVHESAVVALDFSPDGRSLLAGDAGGEVRVWDTDRGAVVVRVGVNTATHAVAFRPDGAAFATACGAAGARLWESATGRPVGAPLVHQRPVEHLAFRPDGSSLVTGSADGSIRLWCGATGLPTGPHLTHGGGLRALLFSRDGGRIATAGADGSVRCWRAPTALDGEPERLACWVRVTTGLEFDEGDAVRRSDGATVWDLRRKLSELGGPPRIPGNTERAPRRRRGSDRPERWYW